jgi:MFS family permease
MVWNWKASLAAFIVGAAIIAVGYAVSSVTNSTISNLQQQLQQTGLTTAQSNAFQGSLNWWQLEKVTAFEPLSEFIIITGIIIIISSVIYAVVSILGGFLDRTKRVKIENAPVNEEQVEEPQVAPQPVAPKTTPVHTTGFPIATGILTIIAASLAILSAFLTVAQIIPYANSYYYQQNLTYLVFPLFAGIWNFVAFGLGLTAGLFSLRRKRFMMTIVGISLLLVGGCVSVLGTGTIGGGWMIIGIPMIILAILSIIFVGVSKNEFMD